MIKAIISIPITIVILCVMSATMLLLVPLSVVVLLCDGLMKLFRIKGAE